jgi:hypothetical protein
MMIRQPTSLFLGKKGWGWIVLVGLLPIVACSGSSTSKPDALTGGSTASGYTGGTGGAGNGSTAGGTPSIDGGAGAGVAGEGAGSDTAGGAPVAQGGSIATGGNLAEGGVAGDAGGATGALGGSAGGGARPQGGGGAGNAGNTGSGGCGNCDWDCCGATCVNTGNDVLNCGSCGNACAPEESCNEGVCGERPCDGSKSCEGGQFCCGASCCDEGMLCCVIPGPVAPSLPACSEPNSNGTCALGCRTCKCASPDTPIATPTGDVPIAELQIGDLVYSVDRDAIVAVPIVQLHRQPARGHAVPRLFLENRQTLEISAGHPTADGRTFGDLGSGDRLGGIRIKWVLQVPYRFDFTYDILPASSTGTYFAAGAWIGSTLAPPEPRSRARLWFCGG